MENNHSSDISEICYLEDLNCIRKTTTYKKRVLGYFLQYVDQNMANQLKVGHIR